MRAAQVAQDEVSGHEVRQLFLYGPSSFYMVSFPVLRQLKQLNCHVTLSI